MMHEYLSNYKVRRSNKAKRPQIIYSAKKGLEIVIPNRVNIDIDKFISANQKWIIKQIKNNPLKKEFIFPNKIYIAYLEKTYNIIYMHSSGKCQYIERPDYTIVLIGDIQEKIFKKLIKEWLIKLANKQLIQYLNYLSKNLDLEYNDASIRGQFTIWGSCSADKNISLNYKLLFLPECLVRYVIIHELCHTKHLNHSNDFWGLVEKYDPDYLLHKKKLSENNIDFEYYD